MGKGEIARFEQFLLFPQCFQKACFPGESKGVIVWEWVTHIYFTSIEKQVLRTCTNLFRFCFLQTTPVLAPNVWANEKIPELTLASGIRTCDLKIARLMLYLTTTDNTIICVLIILGCHLRLLFIQIFPRQQTLDSSEMNKFADGIFKFNENGRMPNR